MRLRPLPLHRVLKPPTHRSLSTSRVELIPRHSIYVSKSTDPYFNLSLEDWLFRHKNPQQPLLLLYRNDPCIVIGRNQNPWKEVNLRLSDVTGIQFIRRRSGGGTVFHDLGNTNYSIHVSRSSFDRKVTAEVIVRAVRSLGIDAGVNDRNDICAGEYKLSGSAYKIVNNRAYHHGTMLIDTKLEVLGDLLHTSKDTMVTKGVASVRSPVQNLCAFKPEVKHESFLKAVISSFQSEYGINDEESYVDEQNADINMGMIQNGMEELKSWDWKYGQTPEFTYTVTQIFEWGEARAQITSKHGIITSCVISSPGLNERAIREVEHRLTGAKYGFIDNWEDHGRKFLENVDPRTRELWNWLREESNS